MVRRGAVSLRGPKPPAQKQSTRPKTFRLPAALDDYLSAASAQLGRSENDIVIGALELDRDLPIELGDDYRAKLDEFAGKLGLTLDKHLAKVLVAAVRRGLDCPDDSKHSKNKK